jgi:hypothetical protein
LNSETLLHSLADLGINIDADGIRDLKCGRDPVEALCQQVIEAVEDPSLRTRPPARWKPAWLLSRRNGLRRCWRT